MSLVVERANRTCSGWVFRPAIFLELVVAGLSLSLPSGSCRTDPRFFASSNAREFAVTFSYELKPLAGGCALRLCSAGREEIGISLTGCPVCHSANTRRSKRRSALDYLFAFAGILPWRCEACATRFYSRLLPFRTLMYAHCGICGNLELQRISAERITGVTSTIGRLLGIQALRCAPCRHKFFSVRPLHREEHPVASAPNE